MKNIISHLCLTLSEFENHLDEYDIFKIRLQNFIDTIAYDCITTDEKKLVARNMFGYIIYHKNLIELIPSLPEIIRQNYKIFTISKIGKNVLFSI